MSDTNNLSTQPKFLKTNEHSITQWVHTNQSKLHKINFRWTIHNFSYLNQEKGKSLTSPTFCSNSKDEIKWFLELYPNGMVSKDHVSLFLKLLSEPSDKSKILAKGKFSILNAELKNIHSCQFNEVHKFITSEDWGFKQFVTRALLLEKPSNFLPNDTLTINCEINFLCDNNNILNQKKIGQFEIPECELLEDFNNLLKDPNFSDITLVVGEHKFQAHKAILAARSIVFAAMLKHEMKESKLNRVIITDVDHEVLQEILHFIYTGDAPKLKEMATYLLAAADKYALQKLKVMAEEALFAEISIEKAAETLVLADLHSADQLKEQTIQFFKIYAKDIVKTKGWQNIVDANNNSSLIAEVLEALL